MICKQWYVLDIDHKILIQSQSRCHRIGQTEQVKVYRLVARNTYEKQMFETALKKLQLDNVVLR